MSASHLGPFTGSIKARCQAGLAGLAGPGIRPNLALVDAPRLSLGPGPQATGVPWVHQPSHSCGASLDPAHAARARRRPHSAAWRRMVASVLSQREGCHPVSPGVTAGWP